MAKLVKNIIGLACTVLASATFAGNKNFVCPDPSEINSTDFTAPSIWTAPGVPRAAKGTIGLGLGGKKAVKLLGAEEALVSNQKGWVCVYQSEGGVSVNEYELKVRDQVNRISYLRKYTRQVDQEINAAEPYLKNYPKDIPLGFIGYQARNK